MSKEVERLGIAVDLDDKDVLKKLNKLQKTMKSFAKSMEKGQSNSAQEKTLQKIEKKLNDMEKASKKSTKATKELNKTMSEFASAATKGSSSIEKTNKSLTNTTKNVQKLQTELKRATAEQKRFSEEMNKPPKATTTNNATRVGGAMNQMGNSAIMAGGAIMYGGVGLGEKYQAFAKNQLRILAIEDEMSAKEFDKMEKETLKMAYKYGVNPIEYSQGLYNMDSVLNGYEKTKPFMDALGKFTFGQMVDGGVAGDVLATGSVNFALDRKSMDDYMDAYAAMVKVSKAESGELAKYVSKMAPAFNAAGGSYTDMFKLYGAVSNTNDAPTSATMINSFIRDMQKQSKINKLNDAIDFLNERGSNYDKYDHNSIREKGADQVAWEIANVYQDLKKAGPKAAPYTLTGTMFGRASTNLMLDTIYNQDGSALQVARDAVDNRKGMMDKAVERIGDTKSGDYEIAKQRLENNLVQIGGELVPVLADLTTAINGVLKVINLIPGPLKTIAAYGIVGGAALGIVGGTMGKVAGMGMSMVGRGMAIGGFPSEVFDRDTRAGYKNRKRFGMDTTSRFDMPKEGFSSRTERAEWQRQQRLNRSATQLSGSATRLSGSLNGAAASSSRMAGAQMAMLTPFGRFKSVMGTSLTQLSKFQLALGTAGAALAGWGSYALTTKAMDVNDQFLRKKVNDASMSIADSPFHWTDVVFPLKGIGKAMVKTFGGTPDWSRNDYKSELNEETLQEFLADGWKLDENTGRLTKNKMSLSSGDEVDSDNPALTDESIKSLLDKIGDSVREGAKSGTEAGVKGGFRVPDRFEYEGFSAVSRRVNGGGNSQYINIQNMPLEFRASGTDSIQRQLEGWKEAIYKMIEDMNKRTYA